MSEAMNLFFYGILPYVVLSIAIIGTTQRYITDQFSISSLSSQFLENKKLFLGTILWHFGILVVLLGHLVAFMIPKTIQQRTPKTLYPRRNSINFCTKCILWTYFAH